jgi:exodeoxyribonuclease VII large subunit
LKQIKVSDLNEQLKSLIESTFLQVSVEGEVSRSTYHSSGHLYFNLKDQKSSIKCVMFRGNNQKMKFRIEDGMKIVANGAVSVYVPNGSYQIICSSISLDGQGDLQFAYEQLKTDLQKMGYFDQDKKKKLPQFPKNIAFLTSKSGAALQDMLKIAKSRWPLTKINLIDTLVQGESASDIISSNIVKADKLGFDVIVLARGGGSLEDLWCFNEKKVAQAIYEAKTPIISAIGHEIDFMISDMVADIRASTPSNAMEILLPDQNEWLIHIDTLMRVKSNQIKQKLLNCQNSIKSLEDQYKQNSIKHKMEIFADEISNMKYSLNLRYRYILTDNSQKIETLKNNISMVEKSILSRLQNTINSQISNYETLKPTKQIKDSFVQVTQYGKKSNLKSINSGDLFDLEDTNIKIRAKAIEKLCSN